MKSAVHYHVLVADDDVELLELIEHWLTSWKYRVKCVSNKRELLREIDIAKPAIILLDLRFGEYDGIEILREIHRQFPQQIVIMFTGHATIAPVSRFL